MNDTKDIKVESRIHISSSNRVHVPDIIVEAVIKSWGHKTSNTDKTC